MGKSVSARHVAALAANLPRGSRVLRAVDPSLGWTDTEYLLFKLLNAWAEEPQPYPWEKAPGTRETIAVEASEFDRLMRLPRKEA